MLVTAALALIIGTFFDHYYEFNDDVLMKDILSGAYAGTPSALNVQMLAPLGWVISGLYRIAGFVPWYGLFLVGIQYVCVFLVFDRSLEMTDSPAGAVGTIASGTVFFLSLLLPHFVMVQYTVTVSMMAGTACFLICTIPAGLDVPAFLKKALIPVLLIVVGYQLRTEMMLLMMPFVFSAALTALLRENHGALDKESLKKYAAAVALVFALMGCSLAVNAIAYSGTEWKAFLVEFDARTTLYDYEYVPDYSGENVGFYEQAGVSESQVQLLQIYDYGIDDRIDAGMMHAVADHAEDLRRNGFADRIRESFKEYAYRCTHFADGAYSALAFMLYLIVIMAMCMRKDLGVGRRLLLVLQNVGVLMLMRTVDWMAITYGRRLPDRITHSLYVAEILVLIAMLLGQIACSLRDRNFFKMTMTVLLILCGLIVLPGTLRNMKDRIEMQEEVNSCARAIDEYCAGRPDCFYWEDVYSTIIDGESFNEKMFARMPRSGSEGTDGRTGGIRVKNYDLIGGWAMNSPILRTKMSLFGLNDVGNDLLDSGKAFLIISDERDVDWVTDHYRDVGIDAGIEVVDAIKAKGGSFHVYRVVRK